jgi:hypothetical protein
MHSRGYLRAHPSFARRLYAGIAGIVLTVAILPALTGALPGSRAGVAHADELTASENALRTGWDMNEPGLKPAIVHGGKFTQLFRKTVTGQVYAQPVMVNGMLVVATEADYVYGMDPVTGARKWGTHLGNPFVVANSSSAGIRNCQNLTPDIGVTGTPAYDPVTGDVYMFGEIMNGSSPEWDLFGLNPSTGHIDLQQVISGHPTNQSALTFNPEMQLERPGVLIQDGAAYGAFAGNCDTSPYAGYVARVSLPDGAVSLWSDEAGPTNDMAGIWQSGGGIMSDGSGRIFVTSGNGVSPPAGPGSAPPGQLAESVIRLSVDSTTGTMTAQDFFSPANAPSLDAADTDYGSGGPVGLPFGTSAYPHELAQAGKDGRIFLLNRDDLGGRKQGSGGGDAVLGVTHPYRGEWDHPAVFGNSTTVTSSARDYLYYMGQNDVLRIFRFGVTSAGKPTLSDVANTSLKFGYTSGSPVVTSVGYNSYTPVLWEVYDQGPAGHSGTLEAYNVSWPVLSKCTASKPCSLSPIWHHWLGTAAKFTIPATSNGRVYVGTRDGHVFGFGVPGAAALATAPPATFAQTGVNSTTAGQVTVTAQQKVTFTGVTSGTDSSNSTATTDQFTVGQLTETKRGQSTAAPVTFPVTLSKGDRLHAAVTFAPLAPGGVAGTLSFATTSTKTPTVEVPVTGVGTQTGLVADPSTLPIAWQPENGITDVPVGIAVPRVVTLTNYGTTTETVASVTPPSSPFSATGMPTAGTQIKPGQSIAVRVTYAPTQAGPASGSFTVTDTDGTSATVNLSGIGTAPVTKFTVDLPVPGPAHIRRLAPASISVNFGKVKTGKTAAASVQITNDGNQPSIITSITPLAAPFHAVYRIPRSLPFNPEYDLNQRVTFSPTHKGTFTTHYKVTWTDHNGTHTLTVTLTGRAV